MAEHALQEMPAPADEQERRRALRNHKAFVTGLLILAAVIFLGCSWWQSQGTAPDWVGYVRAAAEAGMVGGLADWFAVTALFRHPMGLPIPHTALIPKKKDQLGSALSEFVGTNFLNARIITEKVAHAEIPLKVGQWLAEPENAETVSREAGRLTANAVRGVQAADAEQVIRTVVVDKLAQPQWGPPAGRALEQLVSEGKVEPLIDDLTVWAARKIRENEDAIIRVVDERKPVWAPRFVHDLVGEKIFKEVTKWADAVAADPNHEARGALRRFIDQLAFDLQHDPAMIERVEGWKQEILGSDAVARMIPAAWEATSEAVITSAEDPDSVIRRKLAEFAQGWGEKLVADPEARDTLNERIVKVVAFVADNYADQITAIIAETVHSWDAAEASEKIELMVGKDLQFIRLNGTIVGALAGLVIYTVSQLLF
ncbi:uncharacterized membrane protein [Corynebacterium renale]|uniref:DUF445 domain-containing protein n=1 Tax=Corynebacterium renale TaxID=1724 RepID=UPI000DA369E9|nr:DUF445 family protein [Corynebacterium renale]SQG63902.1 uncharacterized membrane protein [Corynebacterium renale]STD02796.1 uncharacterized membrane protein [Corynebacterium renale]